MTDLLLQDETSGASNRLIRHELPEALHAHNRMKLQHLRKNPRTTEYKTEIEKIWK